MTRRLCSSEDVAPAGTDLSLEAGGRRQYLMLFRLRDGAIVGYHNVCPHQGLGLNLSPGRFHFTRAGWLLCPHHGASFDIASGRCVEGPCRGASLRPLPLEIRDGAVWLAEPEG